MYTPETFQLVNRNPEYFAEIALANHGTGAWRAYATRALQHYPDGSQITDPSELSNETIMTARRPAKPKEWKSLDSAAAWLRENGYTGTITVRD